MTRAASAACLALLLWPAWAGAAGQPWVITTPVTVTSPMDVGDVLVADGGSLTVTGVPDPGVRLWGNLVVAGHGRVVFTASVVQVMSVFHGQYAVVASDESSLTIEHCDYRVPNGVQHAIIATGAARVTVTDTAFPSVQLIANAHGTLDAERLDGTFEVILQEPASIDLADIPRTPSGGSLWVWPEFPPGSAAVYSPPLPGLIADWSFPPAGATGIAQSCRITRCQVKLWPLLVREGSDLTIRDVAAENWVIVGLHLPYAAVLSGLVDGRTYQNLQLPLGDRRLVLERAAIRTWNLYPEGTAVVRVSDSTIGELLAMGTAWARLDRVVVDGSGGYFGANGGATVEAYASTFTCDVQVSASATIELHGSRAMPYPFDPTGALTRLGAYDDGRILLDATAIATTPKLAGRGVIAGVWIADPPAHPPAGDLALSGTLALSSLDPAVAAFVWRLEAQEERTRAVQLIGQGHAAADNALLGVWTGADPRAAYELRAVLTDGLGRTLTAATFVPGTSAARRHLAAGH
ncbi:MAG: hypothetical protein EPN53_07985 [Acidobacteria bacterium]|nr:MAG: hypothetical protein EPN53_07985 [Acidobacteriota bacterium]